MALLTNGLSIRRPKKKMNLMNEQRMRFTVRLRIVDAHSVPTCRESQRRRAHWRSAAAPQRVLQRRWRRRPAVDHGNTCCSDWYDFHVSGDTGSSCRQLLWVWGVSDRATRRRHTRPVLPRSFLRYLCRQSRQYGHRLHDLSLISKWWCVSI